MSSLRGALLEQVSDDARVDDYYLPVAQWVERAMQANTNRPYFLGISGPQGSGKSTLAASLAFAFSRMGARAITFSFDDFYLTRAEQIAVAKEFSANDLFEVRGFAGTHDVALGARVLDALANGASTKIPSYDKSAHDGLGDRAPEENWRVVHERQDLVIFEGWMLGFHQMPKNELDSALRASNELLAAYDAWTRKLDAIVLLEARELDFIVKWRVDAEQRRRKNGERTLSDDDAKKYIERFLPVYRAYVPALVKNPPTKDFLRVELGEDRQPVNFATSLPRALRSP